MNIINSGIEVNMGDTTAPTKDSPNLNLPPRYSSALVKNKPPAKVKATPAAMYMTKLIMFIVNYA